MPTFRAKLRRIGNSQGVIIPREVLDEAGAELGEEVDLTMTDRSIDQAEKDRRFFSLFGIIKTTGPPVIFVRDKDDRTDRYYETGDWN